MSAAYNPAAPFYAHALARPTATALVVDDVEYSYGALAARAARIAAELRPVGRALRVGLLCARSVDAYAGLLGAAWGGHAYVPINARLPEERLVDLVRQARLSAIVVDAVGASVLTERVRAAAGDAVVVGPGAFADAAGPATPPVAVAADTVAYIIFTSGTTGTPKGVTITAGNVAHFVAVMRERYPLDERDRVLGVAELSFDLSVLPMYLAWACGSSLHVVPEAKRMTPGSFATAHGITMWVSTPSVATFMQRTRQLVDGALPRVRWSVFCGEALPLAVALAWQRATPNGIVDNQYGPTEATCSCMVQRLEDPPAVTPGRDTVAIGRAYRGMHAALVDDSGRIVDGAGTGELALSGEQVMAGYFDDAALTARRLVRLRHPTLGERTWYLTGDLACSDDNGCFFHLGRVDHQVKLFGHRIELEEIETRLRQIAGTDAVAVIGWPVRHHRVEGIAAFVAATACSVAEIQTQLRAQLPAYMLPRHLVKLDALPLNDNGKVDRRQLEALLSDGS